MYNAQNRQYKNNPFHQASAETGKLEGKLKKSLSPELYTSVKNYIKEEVQREKERLQNKFKSQFTNLIDTLNTRLDDEKATAEQQQAAMKEYVEIISPLRVKCFVDEQIHMKNVVAAYNSFFSSIMKETMFTPIFKRYQPSGDVISLYYEETMTHLKPMFQSLQKEGEAINDHVAFLKTLMVRRKDGQWFRVGAGLLGSAVAGPLGGMVSRGIVRSLTNDEMYILSSFQSIREHWDHVVQDWQYFLLIVEKNLYLLYSALIGGYFIRVNEDLQQLGYILHSFDPKTLKVDYAIKEGQKDRVIQWYKDNEKSFADALSFGSFQYCEQLSGNLVQFMKQNEAAGGLTLTYNNQAEVTLLTAAQSMRFAYYTSLIEKQLWKRGKVKDAVQKYTELISQVRFTVDQYDMFSNNDTPSLAKIILRIIAYTVNTKESDLQELLQSLKAILYVSREDKKCLSIQVLKAFEIYLKNMDNVIVGKPTYSELYITYKEILLDFDMKKDSFSIFLGKHRLYEKLHIGRLVNFTIGYQHVAHKIPVLRGKFVLPILLFVFLLINGVTFANAGRFLPGLDYLYFSKIENHLYRSSLDETALKKAMDKSNYNRAFFLIEEGAIPNTYNSAGYTLISQAVLKNDADLLEKGLQHGVGVDFINGDETFPLYLAIQEKNSSILRFLLDNKANPNQLHNGISVINLAVNKEDIDLVDILISYGADLNEINASGKSIVLLSIEKNNDVLIKYILSHPDLKLDGPLFSELIDATLLNKNTNVLQLLFNLGKDRSIALKDDKLATLLYEAIEKDETAIIAVLLESIGKLTPDYKNILYLAVERANLAVINLLVEKGLNINETVDGKEHPIFTAINKENDELLSLLISLGADVNVAGKTGVTPLLLVAQKNQDTIFNILLDNGASVAVKDNQGRDLKDVILQYDSEKVFLAAVERGMFTNAVLEQLFIDSIVGQKGNLQLELFKLFPNKLHDENPIIFYVIQKEQRSILEALLEAGAEPNVLNSDGKTPLMVVEQMDSPVLESLLKKYGSKSELEVKLDKMVGYWKGIRNEYMDGVTPLVHVSLVGGKYKLTRVEEGQEDTYNIDLYMDDWGEMRYLDNEGNDYRLQFNLLEDKLTLFHNYGRISENEFNSIKKEQLNVEAAKQKAASTSETLIGIWENTSSFNDMEYNDIRYLRFEEGTFDTTLRLVYGYYDNVTFNEEEINYINETLIIRDRYEFKIINNDLIQYIDPNKMEEPITLKRIKPNEVDEYYKNYIGS